MTNIEAISDQLYDLIASVRNNGAYPAESFIKDILTSFEKEIRESEQSRIVNGLQKQLDQRSDEVGDLVEMWCNGILCSIDYIKSLSTKEE